MKTPLKYCGSKNKLSEEIMKYVPADTTCIVEPFCGSLAFSFNAGLPFYAFDAQSELMMFWEALRDYPEELITQIKRFSKDNCREKFMKIRSADRQEGFEDYGCIYRGARYYYIVYSGHNTGYRVNQKNQCNIPWGGDTRKFVLNEDYLREVSAYLKESGYAFINCQFDSEEVFAILRSLIDSGDIPFVLIDPPYVDGDDGKKVYREYTGDKIDNAFHERMLSFMRALTEARIPFVMTNTYCQQIKEIYGYFEINKVQTKYSVSGDKENGTEKFEAFVTNMGEIQHV